MFLTCFSLLMPAFSLLLATRVLTVTLVSPTERSPTVLCPSRHKTRGFGTMLKPRYIFRAKAFDQ
jgi:hypothetical protein